MKEVITILLIILVPLILPLLVTSKLVKTKSKLSYLPGIISFILGVISFILNKFVNLDIFILGFIGGSLIFSSILCILSVYVIIRTKK